MMDTNATIDVPAGRFQGCIRVETLSEGIGRTRVETTLCPDVGIASMVVERFVGKDVAMERVVLRSYGKPVKL